MRRWCVDVAIESVVIIPPRNLHAKTVHNCWVTQIRRKEIRSTHDVHGGMRIAWH